jgi:uncharacterized protein (DUF433 family)
VRKQYRKDVTVEAVTAAYESGMRLDEMVLQFRCSMATLLNRLREGGVARRREGFGGTGRPVRVDVTVEASVALYRQGLTLEEIAERLHCTGTTVSNRLKTVGIRPDPYRRGQGRSAPCVATSDVLCPCRPAIPFYLLADARIPGPAIA